MRKLLIILLLAAIACSEVKETNEEINNLLNFMGVEIDDVEFSWIQTIYEKVSDYFKKIWGKIKGGIQWLKDNGYWDTLVSLAKTVGKVVAVNYCSAYLTPPVCGLIVDAIFSFI